MINEKKTYTPKQLEVINADTGYNMVLAGPGCGKTDFWLNELQELTEKAAYSSQICCV